MIRAFLRVIAGMVLGAMVGWLLNDFPQINHRSFTSVDFIGSFSAEQMEEFRQEAKRRVMKEEKEIRKSKQEFNNSVMNMIYLAMIFGGLAACRILFDLKALVLQRNQTGELHS